MAAVGQQHWTRKYLIPLLWTGAIVYTIAFAFNFRKRSLDAVIWSDAEGYYMYLPAVFIYDGFEDIPVRTGAAEFRPYPGTDKIFDKYTCGVAMMQLPFFLAAHAVAVATPDYPPDGHSPPYVISLLLAGLCHGFLGIFLLRTNLRVHFKGITPDIVALSLLLGTNLLHYIAREPGMSHVYSFVLFNLFIWLTDRYYRTQGSWPLAWGLAATLGWIVLIRPTNLLLALFFFFYTTDGRLDIRERLQFLWERFAQLWLFPLLGLLWFVPQMLYWKYATGSFLVDSYQEEGFIYWNDPKLWEVLFSIKNGWLLFSPLLALALIGLLAGAIRGIHNSRLILIIWILCWYAFSSWSSWWFGGAFGHRAFVEFYALLAFPLALVVQWILSLRQWWWPVLFFAVWLLLIYYNLGLDEHYFGPHYEWWSWRAAMEMMFSLD
ncbi:hypothetical protein [Flavilitoribacter nigricans]|uniref:Glycosyltransferase RgtA/B/C/D-like domain-containing protein n=1 Tax=Flavilitoribacter nigricans (strain ATCC 23147 / DSM 23189 / NBRC 102662 / NCIMB 1420 / SS-2) TaxID=1122177 RepID=A0A2D0MXU2_FLAN2|nr:hypothetical protein [Flavilitoribacter nigricans]PHN00958.1 hypothetical protein CRP01_39435 [Flavilitoribacter nigricans DSM 23189 = NBRC 102662]